ncbi:MAG: diguanylate cyclase [Wenzhouxiangella sp.]|nr:MAG: diguanylate cyclase [Wenzhouxiangella sp.]
MLESGCRSPGRLNSCSDLSLERGMHIGLCLLVALLLLAGPVKAGDDLQKRIDFAAELQINEPGSNLNPVIDQLLSDIEQATPGQQVSIRLLAARNLGLQGRIVEGLEFIDQILAAEPEPGQRLTTYRLSANLAMNLGDYERAFADLMEAVALIPETGSPFEETNLYGLASYFHGLAGESFSAISYAQRSLESAQETDNPRLACLAYGRLTAAFEADDRLIEAEQSGRQGLSYCEQTDDPVTTGWIHALLASVLISLGELDQAEAMIAQATANHSDVYHQGQLNSQRLLARLMIERSQFEPALEKLDNLISAYEKLALWERLAEVHWLAARAAASLGQTRLAYDHTLKHIDARERFLSNERALRLAYLEVEFASKQREQELMLLREQARVESLRRETIEQQALFRKFAYGFGLFLLLILLLLLLHAVRRRRHFQHLSRRDGLSGLLNHTSFFEAVEQTMGKAQRDGQPLTLLMADMDHFKQINDRHGHLKGDAVLRQTAAGLANTFGKQSLIGRIGGEEFAVCLSGVTIRQAAELAEKLREDMGTTTSTIGRPVTMSFGIAEMAAGENLDQLRKRADDALYQAKRNGRDRVELAPARQGE